MTFDIEKCNSNMTTQNFIIQEIVYDILISKTKSEMQKGKGDIWS